MKNEISLRIKALPRVMMLVLTAFQFLGIFAFLLKWHRDGRVDDHMLFHLGLVLICLPGIFTLISIPALLQKYPSWVIRIYGENYLRRLCAEANLAWEMAEDFALTWAMKLRRLFGTRVR